MKARIRERALQLGFDVFGAAPAVPPPHGKAFVDWLRAGRHAGMAYLERRAAERLDPGRVLPGSVVLPDGDYHVTLVLTEDSFHTADGSWPTVLGTDVSFTVGELPLPPNPADDVAEVSEDGEVIIDVLLNDAPAVAAALSLLVLADHPGHATARFHVSSTPLGKSFGLRPGASEREGARLGHRVRKDLLDRGFARTLHDWRERIASSCDAHDLRRFGQLVALAERFEAGGGSLRAAEFADRVREEKVEDPAAAGVRIMTIHKAKGLEFDAVFLPELDGSFFSHLPWFLVKRKPCKDPERISAYAAGPVCLLDPELDAMHSAWRAERVQEGLCNLYVALTRARHAVYIYLPHKVKGVSFAHILERALRPNESGGVHGKTVFELGEPMWYEKTAGSRRARKTAAGTIREISVTPPLLRKGKGSRRNLVQRAPSRLHGMELPLERLLSRERSEAREKGVVFHAWFERVGWLDEASAPPGREILEAAAREAGFEPVPPEAWLREFTEACRLPEIRKSLSKSRYARFGRGPALELLREHPFIVRIEDEILQGRFDRLVVGRDGKGVPLFAEVLDYKTDPLLAGEGRKDAVERMRVTYAPQMNAYRRAAALLFRLAPEKVTACLILTHVGAVAEIAYTHPGGG